MNFKVSPSSHAERLAGLILLFRDPLVKGSESEAPVFAHADARDATFAGEPLQSLGMDAKMLRCLICREQRLKGT